ncbi:D-glycero-beta-D-manno-heptose 1,7-bisphosphate 7-phosphatase [Chitinimonas taiwanensis]|jgi:D-glycero-D-manno-heptose 1,7-bisphosphate phosphatase|uniref:D,D-heptose 1,7-bisphosphate phosphatase n=1 Tax=Chitinimonas taiwanensis DSM 18899 TaxID=1121279 RepID=A0A1K2HNT5_9NEIS|nr:D-glycero-beta-D-manno-heptose 1,7-bisphosphate 7-phosphatase [Chitinimonas taiwanensis]SFZ78460.1 D-alpha,beta-D-heptose 1,7-bisphosphate phosphatase [Chitinimonas taiwanensis DSM 18899]
MKLVILDRDGVINHDRDDFVKSAAEWIPINGSLEAIALLNHVGWRVVIASNQSGIGRGFFGMAELNAMHDKLHRLLAGVGGRVDAIFFCPHTADMQCNCRKPKPGMYKDIAQRFDVRLEKAIVVGDSLRDLEAAAAVGAQPILVRTGKGEKTLAKGGLPENTKVFYDLMEAVLDLIGQEES